MPSGAGSIVALSCHMVRGMEGIGTRLPGASGGEAWWIDARNKNQRGTVFPPLDSNQGRLARHPPTGCIGGRRRCPSLFHEAGSRLVHRYRVYKDPFPHSALRDGVIPRLLSSVCRAMAIARLTHLQLSIPLLGAPQGKVPESCYPEAESAVAQPLPRRVSFTEDVETLHTKDDLLVSSETSPPLTQPVVEELEEDTSSEEVDEIQICASQISPPLTQPVVEGIEDDTPTSEVDELDNSSPESERPPPPGFPPFVFPEDDVGDKCGRDLCAVREICGRDMSTDGYEVA